MELIPCGTEVKLKRAEYLGVITGITIRDNRVIYDISYFEDGTYKENVFAPYEFSIISEYDPITIGFKHLAG